VGSAVDPLNGPPAEQFAAAREAHEVGGADIRQSDDRVRCALASLVLLNRPESAVVANRYWTFRAIAVAR